MANDAILNARQAIRKDFSSYDSSFKIKKMKIVSILNDIDSNTSIEDSEITRKFNIWYNLAMLYAKRVSPSLVSWLDNSRYVISECLEIYKSTYSTIYKVDENFEDWWMGQPHEFDFEHHYSWYAEKEPVLLEYKGVVYVFKRSDSKYIIRILNKYDDSIALNYEYTVTLDGVTDKWELHCNNVNCPHYKSSMGKVYNDGAKAVFCSLEDLQKCGQCEKANVVHPLIVSELFNGIAYTMEYRTSNASDSKSRDDYEHLPKQERVDDVIVYFGGVVEHKPLPFLKVSDMEVEKVFPDSHASPREHYRRGSERRAYTRKDGTKVKATTVKGTIVNKGHTKTSYVLKERK